jgi:hypothetical protein
VIAADESQIGESDEADLRQLNCCVSRNAVLDAMTLRLLRAYARARPQQGCHLTGR